jgi:endo-1,4-beta-xylanase
VTAYYENNDATGTIKSDVFTSQANMLEREDMYVRTLLNHIKNSGYSDVVYAYDVVNEYTNMANEGDTYLNFWKYIFGTEMKTDCVYVKKAFASAYDECVELGLKDQISLIYNDYNTYDHPDTIVELINNINKKDDLNPDGNKICDGIGMQSHINDSSTTAARYEEALKKFAAADFEIQITELDVTNTGYVTSETTAEKKASVWEKNAKLYGELMTAIVRQKKAGANISSITIWGMTDAGSWRSDQAPLLFGSDLADKKPSFDAVINAVTNYQG